MWPSIISSILFILMALGLLGMSGLQIYFAVNEGDAFINETKSEDQPLHHGLGFAIFCIPGAALFLWFAVVMGSFAEYLRRKKVRRRRRAVRAAARLMRAAERRAKKGLPPLPISPVTPRPSRGPSKAELRAVVTSAIKIKKKA